VTGPGLQAFSGAFLRSEQLPGAWTRHPRSGIGAGRYLGRVLGVRRIPALADKSSDPGHTAHKRSAIEAQPPESHLRCAFCGDTVAAPEDVWIRKTVEAARDCTPFREPGENDAHVVLGHSIVTRVVGAESDETAGAWRREECPRDDMVVAVGAWLDADVAGRQVHRSCRRLSSLRIRCKISLIFASKSLGGGLAPPSCTLRLNFSSKPMASLTSSPI
jgi:hypothetical protein